MGGRAGKAKPSKHTKLMKNIPHATLLRELLRTWAKVLQKSDRGSIEPPNWIPGRTSIEAGPTFYRSWRYSENVAKMRDSEKAPNFYRSQTQLLQNPQKALHRQLLRKTDRVGSEFLKVTKGFSDPSVPAAKSRDSWSQSWTDRLRLSNETLQGNPFRKMYDLSRTQHVIS